MHPDIAKFPSYHFYHNKILSPLGVQVDHIFKRNFPIYFIDINDKEEQTGNSFLNRDEADIVNRTIKYMKIKLKDFKPAVITPYLG